MQYNSLFLQVHDHKYFQLYQICTTPRYWVLKYNCWWWDLVILSVILWHWVDKPSGELTDAWRRCGMPDTCSISARAIRKTVATAVSWIYNSNILFTVAYCGHRAQALKLYITFKITYCHVIFFSNSTMQNVE